jgi:nitroreductase
MEILECVEKRRSVREYEDEDVPEDVVNEALRVASLAPSAGNLQARDFIVVRDQQAKDRMVPLAHNQRFLATAPVVVVGCANLDRIAQYGPRGRELFSLQDVAASVENMMLYLTSAGYGSCWIGAFDEHGISELLGLPDHARPVVIMPIGRPKNATRMMRPKAESYVHSERW